MCSLLGLHMAEDGCVQAAYESVDGRVRVKAWTDACGLRVTGVCRLRMTALTDVCGLQVTVLTRGACTAGDRVDRAARTAGDRVDRAAQGSGGSISAAVQQCKCSSPYLD